MTTPIERLSNLVIGSVESVSSDEVRILLEIDSPHNTALNTGTPVAFPRINGYVLIPNEAGATVAYIYWIGIERSPYPKRAGLKDFGLIDLPFPLRKMLVSPIGTLTSRRDRTSGTIDYEMSRGVLAFPSVGDQVLMPTSEQIESIVGATKSDRRVRIGSSPLASNAAIMVDPDKIFGRHLAILGNTGSGKSCTVAGLIRWSIDEAQKVIDRNDGSGHPNARFVVLDPNGEYARAFSDEPRRTRVFRVPPVSAQEKALQVPAWLWNGQEWTAVANAQPGVQRPLLLQGLRELKAGQPGILSRDRDARVRNYLVSYSIRLSAMLHDGSHAGGNKQRFACADLLNKMAIDCTVFAQEVEDQVAADKIGSLVDTASQVRERQRRNSRGVDYFDDFPVTDLEEVLRVVNDAVETLPDAPSNSAISEDDPVRFDVNMLDEYLERIALDQGGPIMGFISTLGLRIKGMLADQRLGNVIGNESHISFEQWLTDYIGDNDAQNGQVAIIDLSLVPSEVVHTIVAVLARLVLESLQRYRRDHPAGLALPTVLVLEEAHTFIRKGNDEAPTATPAQLCREAFERIAREGRKFGLGLVLSSQRPSELSPTVLAQCNTFMLHRIVNDVDQKLVSRLVPDNLGGLLRELPSLPSRQAIMLGWATPIPVMVEVDELPESQRPQSSDPDFWDVWTRTSERLIDWAEIARGWSGGRHTEVND